MGVAFDVSQSPKSWSKAAAEENPSMCVTLDVSQSASFWLEAAAEENPFMGVA